MRHFVKETVYNNTLGTSVDIQRLWQDVVTDEALNHSLVSFALQNERIRFLANSFRSG